jgi:predicted SAM-dependent methyltransferase
MKYLNLGCGSNFSSETEWTNVNFDSTGPVVITHNLLNGIPFENNYFDVVYHSHVLEHFTKSDAKKFLIESLRVLKPNGIIRVAVPDLERIAKEYLKNMELALQGNESAAYDYEWIMLELYDQTVRNESGGDMAKYLFQKDVPNEKYVFERIGEEGRNLRKLYLQIQERSKNIPASRGSGRRLKEPMLGIIKSWLKKKFFQQEIEYFNNLEKEVSIGKFRLSGEIHQWMYDRYSLSKLLFEVGFSNPEVKDAFTSKIPNWNNYELETKNGIIYKPDSLFMEAIKP